MKRLTLAIVITLLFITPFNVFAEEEKVFDLKEEVFNDFKDADYLVSNNTISKNDKQLLSLINDEDYTLVFKVHDAHLDNEELKELLLDVVSKSVEIDGSYAFVYSNDSSYFVMDNDEEVVFRISNINENSEIKVSLIKNGEYINQNYSVNLDNYNILNGDTFIPESNNNSSSELPDGYTKVDDEDKTVIKDEDGNDSFIITKKDEETVIKVEESNKLDNEEIKEFITDTVMNSYNITSDEYNIKINEDSTIIFDKKDGSQTITISNINKDNEYVVSLKDNTVSETVQQNANKTTKQIIIFESVAIVILIALVSLLGVFYIKHNKKK